MTIIRYGQINYEMQEILELIVMDFFMRNIDSCLRENKKKHNIQKFQVHAEINWYGMIISPTNKIMTSPRIFWLLEEYCDYDFN